jgi:tripartite-type tricarboxylate transporter receptor subunit TctC
MCKQYVWKSASDMASTRFARVVRAAGAFEGRAAGPTPDFGGETIGIEIGYGPGGGYDTYARLLAKHFGRFIPGNPNVVPRNMPGAGSLRAANFIYNLAPKDGTELGAWAASTVMEPLLGNELAKFDAAKFGWIGSMNQDISFCGIWQKPGAATSFRDLLTIETIFGSAGPASISFQHPLVLKNLLGANARVVTGYAGSREVNLAMQRGEVNGACGLFVSSIKSQFLQDVQEGRLKLVIQMGPKTTDEFGKVPSIERYWSFTSSRYCWAVLWPDRRACRRNVSPPYGWRSWKQ